WEYKQVGLPVMLRQFVARDFPRKMHILGQVQPENLLFQMLAVALAVVKPEQGLHDCRLSKSRQPVQGQHERPFADDLQLGIRVTLNDLGKRIEQDVQALVRGDRANVKKPFGPRFFKSLRRWRETVYIHAVIKGSAAVGKLGERLTYLLCDKIT